MTRKELIEKGWKEIFPGVYVPEKPTKPSHWVVSEEKIEEILKEHEDAVR